MLGFIHNKLNVINSFISQLYEYVYINVPVRKREMCRIIRHVNTMSRLLIRVHPHRCVFYSSHVVFRKDIIMYSIVINIIIIHTEAKVKV